VPRSLSVEIPPAKQAWNYRLGLGGERYAGLTAQAEAGLDVAQFRLRPPTGGVGFGAGAVQQVGMGAEFYIPLFQWAHHSVHRGSGLSSDTTAESGYTGLVDLLQSGRYSHIIGVNLSIDLP